MVKVKVIITDVESRKGFDTVSIIKKLYKFEAVLCASKDHKYQLPVIYGQKVNLLRNKSYDAFEIDFFSLLSANASCKLVYLPVSENTTRHFYTFLEKQGKPEQLHFLLPDKKAFETTSHKGLFQKHCEQHHFPVPKSFPKEDVVKPDFPFHPLIAKPFSGEGSVGIKHIDHPKQLQYLESLNPATHLIQEKVQGIQKVAGAFFLCKNGMVLNRYTHQRLRTFPENGGVTVFSKSGNNSEILAIGTELLRSLNWNGLAMIEFIQDQPSREWRIIELNPRLWGSVLLSAFNESQMLKDYVHYSLDSGALPQIPTEPLENKYIRWWFPFEVLSFIKGKLSFGTLMKFDLKTTCYINFTYTSVFSSLAYLLYFTFNGRSFKRFLKKLN